LTKEYWILLRFYHTFILIVLVFVVWIIGKRVIKGRFKLSLRQQLEYYFLIIPILIIIILIYLRLPYLFEISSIILINIVSIIGYQWYWVINNNDIYIQNCFSYINETKEVYVGNNRFISITGRANDVIHRIYIPRIYFKIDLIPGRLSTTSLEVGRLINYGVCAEICGANHAFMPFTYRPSL